jgi:hypothetical protein
MGSSRRIEKYPQSGWGCMGGGATDHHLEGNLYPVQLYGTVPYAQRKSRGLEAVPGNMCTYALAHSLQ